MAVPSTPPEPAASGSPHLVELTGWGRTAPTAADLRRPTSPTELRRSLPHDAARGTIARGLGRSYGDAAQNSGGRVIETTDVAAFTIHESVSADGGRHGDDSVLVTADAGVSLDRLLHSLVAQGLFVPVSPGTRYVTVGGAIAADIHGKNHHRRGSWCDHVESLRLQLADGSVVEIGPGQDPELFWATAGGMGLTGIILDATFRCPRIGSSRLLVDTDRAPDLDSVLTLMTEGDRHHDYSVAWIDLMATGASMGRSVLTRGRFATAEEAGPDPLTYRAGVLATAPPVVPGGVLNGLTVRAFNELWFRKAPRQRRGELQSIPTFFHPLDMVAGWNRIYGRGGFVQWQFVIPFEHDRTLTRIVEELSSARCTSFLAVLKGFGPANPGPLSFPSAGWTLALDIPAGVAGLGPLLDRLDEMVASVGGRVYLAKDARLRADLLPEMYPRLDEWREIRERVDPERRLMSDLARRLGL